jgi:D-glycero-alpha-D-manno-heptose-7-phosphate kinase
MIICKTPLRVSLVGGGSDQPAFCTGDEIGHVLSLPISRYIYITVQAPFVQGEIKVAYNKVERVQSYMALENEAVRACLTEYEIEQGVEIHSIADLPAGLGLGSSSAFIVGLVNALSLYRQQPHGDPWILARTAFAIERTDCHRPVGSQDHIVAAVGMSGLYSFEKGHPSRAASKRLSWGLAQYEKLKTHLLLLYTGKQHDAPAVLGQQVADLATDTRRRANVRAMANLAEALYNKLVDGADPDCVAEALNTAWALKRDLPGVTHPFIDGAYERALAAGAMGGKLLGAGDGGCFLFYAPPEKHRDIVRVTGFQKVPFQPTNGGSWATYM